MKFILLRMAYNPTKAAFLIFHLLILNLMRSNTTHEIEGFSVYMNSSSRPSLQTRRDVLRLVKQHGAFFAAFGGAFGVDCASSSVISNAADSPESDPTKNEFDATIMIEKSGDRTGLELINVKLGSNQIPALAIKSISKDAKIRKNPDLQPGMILKDYSSAQELQKRLRDGPYPVSLVFRNFAGATATGTSMTSDAVGDLGKPIATAEDALKISSQPTTRSPILSSSTSRESDSSYSFKKTIIKSNKCNLRSRRLDVLEIIYDAYYITPDTDKKILYDSSSQRGTGRPYQMVLGSGDMLPGVDQGLYDMCPGDKRVLEIPPLLAYGNRGNRLFAIPPNSTLLWEVELVSVNSVTRDDPEKTREEMEERVPYY